MLKTTCAKVQTDPKAIYHISLLENQPPRGRSFSISIFTDEEGREALLAALTKPSETTAPVGRG